MKIFLKIRNFLNLGWEVSWRRCATERTKAGTEGASKVSRETLLKEPCEIRSWFDAFDRGWRNILARTDSTASLAISQLF